MTTSDMTNKTYAKQATAKGWLKNMVSNALGSKRTATEARQQTLKVSAPATRMEEMAYLLKSIGPIYSTPFLLFYKGYDYQEIAAQLNLPVGTVKSRVFSARVKMKQMIAKRKAA